MGMNLVKMCLPLRLGLFSLLSERQISITDPQLNTLMHHLASEPGVQYYEKPELYARVQLQKQALDSFADHKRNLVSAKKPYAGSITEHFDSVLKVIQTKVEQEAANTKEIEERSKKKVTPLDSFYRAYRIIVTPTLFKVLKLSLDETNRIIRTFQKRSQEDYLLRISFRNEYNEQDHYGSTVMQHLLKD